MNFTAHAHNLTFKEELAKLNASQRLAVEQLEGPVLVLAGPGTGKTQLLSARIGNILTNTDAKSHNILCLTYTDAGAVAMRKRLLQFIGPEAYRVNIYTFHGFCNHVIQENLEYFGMHDLMPITELESVELFVQLIDSFSSDNPLKKYTGDIYSSAGRLRSLFNSMKSEHLSVEHLCEKIDEYVESLPSRDFYTYKRANAKSGIKIGDLKKHLLDEECSKMVLLKAAVQELPKYEKLMQDIKRYDFQDMINWVLKAFKDNDALLAKYQERYLYTLVDEYQDTNGSQNEILTQLTSFWDSPNLFVVGDDDQSIYSFQGANLERIKTFVSKFGHDLYPVVLTENYRSTQSILDAAKYLIEHNTERLIHNPTLVSKVEGLHKNLVAANLTLKDCQTQCVHLQEYLNTLHEEAGIVKKIKELYEQGTDLRDVALIYRNHRNVANIMKALDHLKIPYQARLKINILELPMVQNIFNLLRYIHEESVKPGNGEYLLFEVMHYEFFGIEPRDIAIIAKECSIKDKGQLRSWRNMIGSKSRMLKLGLVSASAISKLEENISDWLQAVYNCSLQELFERVINFGNILSFVMKSKDKHWLLEVLNTVFDFLKDELYKNPKLGLAGLLSTIRRMEANNITMPLNRCVQTENGINLITAHSSKGLEYKTVFLMNCTAESWEKKRGSNFQFQLPDTIVKADQPDRTEEERRLFYVAMTRAREKLYISYPSMKLSDKEESQSTLEKSSFVAEILTKLSIPVEHIALNANEISDHTYQSLAIPSLDNALLEKDYINDALKNYRLSVSHLNKYLECPVTFYFENVIKVPQAHSVSASFGSAIHYALERLFEHMRTADDKSFPTPDEFVRFFETGMSRFATHFTPQEYNLKIEYAHKLLPDYYQHYHHYWNKFVTLEYRINNTEIAQIPVTGVIDKIEMNGKSCNVVDYKSGDPAWSRAKVKAPDAKNPLGGEYWRQIVFYKLLLDNDKSRRWDMVSGEIDFVQKAKGKTEFEKYKIMVKPEDTDYVRQQLIGTYRNIIAHKFTPGCGKPECRWCSFVKYNYRTDALMLPHTEQEENLHYIRKL